MKLEFGYGNTVEQVEVSERNLLATLKSNPIEHKFTGAAAVEQALQNPIGAKRLSEFDLSGKKIAVITSDISRPLPS